MREAVFLFLFAMGSLSTCATDDEHGAEARHLGIPRYFCV